MQNPTKVVGYNSDLFCRISFYVTLDDSGKPGNAAEEISL